MTCRPELVTGFVDGALDAEETARVAAHLETCAECRAQADGERLVRTKLRGLRAPEPRTGLEGEVRAALRPRRVRLLRVLLPLAAALAVVAVWLRGSPVAVARELAFDHVKCFRHAQVPAKVFSSDVVELERWFSGQGTALPRLPVRLSGLELQGARYCPLLDGTLVAHVYYRDGSRHVSVFVLPRSLRMETGLSTTALGRSVRLIGRDEQTLGVVGESAADVEAFSTALLTRTASGLPR
jgi:anti-sigma factor RsiW